MFNKKNITKGLILLDAGAILGMIISRISCSTIDKSIIIFANNMIRCDDFIGVQNWLIYLTIICAVVGTYLTAKEKKYKG